jgi:PPOX class probable F420-dependent enzyme
MNDIERQFLVKQFVAHLATADGDGVPHVVPVCFTILESTVYIAIDQKPKSGDPRALKRIQNIAANPSVALIVDHYEDDWQQLAWVMLRGTAEILESGDEREAAHTLLRQRYKQYEGMDFLGLPMIAIRIARTSSWGQID